VFSCRDPVRLVNGKSDPRVRIEVLILERKIIVVYFDYPGAVAMVPVLCSRQLVPGTWIIVQNITLIKAAS
jgi:hypothetical protein